MGYVREFYELKSCDGNKGSRWKVREDSPRVSPTFLGSFLPSGYESSETHRGGEEVPRPQDPSYTPTPPARVKVVLLTFQNDLIYDLCIVPEVRPLWHRDRLTLRCLTPGPLPLPDPES